ncbi:MAG TPA: extracellular solute-binding protein [Burkholderiales bacterium]|nr:extracellular solute-binding protein [Burkholderiales bacterium]
MKLRAGIFVALLFAAFGVSVQAAELTVAAFPAVDKIVQGAIPLWKKKHPDVDIKIVSREYADHHNAITLALATGSNVPDVTVVEVGFVARFAEGGGLEDLSKPPYNAGQYLNKFAPYSVGQAVTASGVIAVIPTDIGPGTLFYRKDILQKAGVSEADMTKSWESYIAAGSEIKAATGAYLMAHARDLKDIAIRSNLKDGEGIYFDKDNKVLVENARFYRAFELAKTVRSAKLDAKIGAWSNEWSEGFKRGTVATQMMGAWLGGHLANWLAPNTKGLWRAANLPDGAFASWGGSFYAIPKGGKNKELAWEFIKLMTLSKEIQLAAFKSQDAFPALLEVQNDPFFEQPIEFLNGQTPRAMWRDAANRIRAIDVNKYDAIAGEIINSELDKVLDQGKDIKAALADAKALIERRARR